MILASASVGQAGIDRLASLKVGGGRRTAKQFNLGSAAKQLDQGFASELISLILLVQISRGGVIAGEIHLSPIQKTYSDYSSF